MSGQELATSAAWSDGDDETRAWLRKQLASRLTLASSVGDWINSETKVSILAPSTADHARLASLDAGGLWDGAALSQVQKILVGLVRGFLRDHSHGAAIFEHALAKPTDPAVQHLAKRAFKGEEVYSWVDGTDSDALINSAIRHAWNYPFTSILVTHLPREAAQTQLFSDSVLAKLAASTSTVFVDAFDGDSVAAAWLPLRTN